MFFGWFCTIILILFEGSLSHISKSSSVVMEAQVISCDGVNDYFVCFYSAVFSCFNLET